LKSQDILELIRSVKRWGAHPNAWAEALTGQRLQGDFNRNLTEILASPTSASKVLDSLSPQATVALALLVENDEPWFETLFVLELSRVIGPTCVPAAVSELTSRGLWFTARPSASWIKENVTALPDVLKTWLRPEVAGLLRATDKAIEIPETETTSAPIAFDPGLDLAFLLAGVATLRPRITVNDGRLFARERTKLAALLKQPDSFELDNLVGELSGFGLLQVKDSGNQPRLEPNWQAVEEWAVLPASDRVRMQLTRVLESRIGKPILAASGAWMTESPLRRQHAMVRQGYYPQPLDRLIRSMDDEWAQVKTRISSWPELEVFSRGDRWAVRLHPRLAAALNGRTCPPTKLHVQASFEVLVPRESELRDVTFIARIADLVQVDTVATFRITRESARRAVMSGLALDKIGSELKRLSAFGVPESVERSMQDFVGQMGRCTLRSTCLLEFDEATLAKKAAGLLGQEARPVTSTIFEVATSAQKTVLQKLDRAGMLPRNAPAPSPSPDASPVLDEDGWEDDHDDPDDWDDDPYTVGPTTPAARFAAALASAQKSWPTLALGLHLPPARVAAVCAARELGEGAMAQTSRLRESTQVKIGPKQGKLFSMPASRSLAAPAAAPVIEKLGPPQTTPAEMRDTLFEAYAIDAEVAVFTKTGHAMRFRPIEIVDSDEPSVRGKQGETIGAWLLAELKQVALIPATARRLGRNEPCPCQSGRKFKRCCAPPLTVL
jgi:hypothetical protein